MPASPLGLAGTTHFARIARRVVKLREQIARLGRECALLDAASAARSARGTWRYRAALLATSRRGRWALGLARSRRGRILGRHLVLARGRTGLCACRDRRFCWQLG